MFGGGPTHASDIVYWLGTYRYNTDRLWTESDKHLCEKMQSTLIAFAQTGKADGILTQIVAQPQA
jgi:carboxylesterase type B